MAQYMQGKCYYNGEGVDQDMRTAMEWFREAADQGNAMGQYMLGFCYAYGTGVAKDSVEAVKLYRKAAAQGDENAKAKLKEIE